LNLDESDVVTDAPPQFVSAGSPLLIVCLNSSEAVDRAQLQPSLLPDALGSVNSVGTFLFARKDLRAAGNFDVYSRMFAPQTGIAEDPATGGATGPLAGYMLKYGMLPASSTHFTSEQGVKMRRPSLLHVRVEPNGESPSIKVGGAVVPIAEGRFYVPFSAPM
jgi:trans-2,3-dihydro-3-hydroxyanthranilate isomerase